MWWFAVVASIAGLTSLTRARGTWSRLHRGIELAARSYHADSDDYNPRKLYPAHNFSMPVDHFHNDTSYAPHSNDSFNLRYWFDSSHYQAGGPVILLVGGETAGEGRLRYIQKGIVAKLVAATNGISIVIEHRFYGTSMPTPDLSVKSLRFLTTDQSMADTAHFARNIRLPGLEDVDISPKTTPWIAFGGSYAGGVAAFLRKVYPEVFWGAIATSGVTVAIVDYWRYYEAQRLYGPPACINVTQQMIQMMDKILLGQGLNNTENVKKLKGVFSLGNLTHNADFAMVLLDAMDSWQGRNWDPKLNSPLFSMYCQDITSEALVYPELEGQRSTVEELLRITGSDSKLATPLLNYGGWVNATQIPDCKVNQTVDDCFTNYNATYFQQDSISQWPWRSWTYQECSQWGYFVAGANYPPTIQPVISRAITMAHARTACVLAFNRTADPDVAAINKHGGFDLRYPRLAFVDGEADPWRGAGVHALEGARPRVSTVEEPYVLIEGAVHHWDENGLFDNQTTAELPPPAVRRVQEAEVAFVKAWVEKFQEAKKAHVH